MKKVILVGLMFVGFVSFSQNKPTTYKLGKSVVTVWENQKTGTYGDYTEKVYEINKIYKKGNAWKETNKFTKDELLQLRAVIDKAILEEEVEVE
jgi:hypothetical protein